MRFLFTWLALFGILVGLQGRVLASDPCKVLASLHEAECGDHGHSHHDHDHSDDPQDSSHDDQCPQDHHHHGNCGHCMPVFADELLDHGKSTFGFSLSPVRLEHDSPPEGPFADLDKPPLI
jgi:hypothetical protein